VPPFFPRREHDLYTMPVEQLLAHLRAARAAGDADQDAGGQAVLAFREEPRIRARVRRACPAAPDWVHEEITGKAVDDTMAGAWRGDQIGSFRAWSQTIVHGKVSEFFRTQKGEAVLHQRSFEDPDGRDLLERLHTGGEDLADALDRSLRLDGARVVLGRLGERNAGHAEIVEAALFSDRPSREVAAEHGTSAANVDQICTRYRRDLRRFVQEEI